jgi:CheY-like chemotaxis protein
MEKETILLVDDDSVNLTLLRLLISRRYDYRLIEAIDGQSALAMARSNPSLALILLDVQMPDLSGIEVCRRLKNDEKTREIPIVLISAVHTDDGSIREGLDAGADGYITKPIEDNMLQSWIRAALRINELKRALEVQGVPAPGDLEATLKSFSKLSHEVNNPLQSIMASGDLLGMELEDSESLNGVVDNIQESAERIAQIVGAASRQAKASLKTLQEP